MKMEDAIRWVSYWEKANMVNTKEIETLEDAKIAIKHCSCLRRGVARGLTPDTLLWAVKTVRGD